MGGPPADNVHMMMIVLIALACVSLVLLAAAAASVLRREVTLRRWRHGHPALIPLRFAVDSRRGASQLRRV
jgi:uncharacterized membrane protein YdjX (TVP38/TMEM64 family)